MTAYMDHKDLANERITAERTKEIAGSVRRVMDAVAEAERSSKRPAGSVRLEAATKTRDVGEIMAAIDAGIGLIGENRPQEVAVKAAGLRRQCVERGLAIGRADGGGSSAGTGVSAAESSAVADTAGTAGVRQSNDRQSPAGARAAGHVDFHLIGQLQPNKIGKVLPVVDTIESVGSLALAEKISRRAVARGLTVGVLLEVNESGEAAKSGCNPKNAIDIARRIGIMGGLHLRGLMTIGAHVDDEIVIRRGFEHLRRLRDQLLESQDPGTADCRELSMGMTADMAYAIAEGSTIVRVGTGIFGQRAFI
ncbi:YggS family pyridoxal phosphate-dependent enzyme [Bifidobacterium mongoliense]|uniref:YggS family pyridoxal phosphate-dependent enzyme n=1 Tax=Bifidobacterium mongoliense TaxID=518643 RepID=UPI00264D435B|nr:YggS family pyridoxal phosphate-dependent enzyme [Bifidobacterium mongoliense]